MIRMLAVALAAILAGCSAEWPKEPSESGVAYKEVQVWPGEAFHPGRIEARVRYFGRDSIAVRFRAVRRGEVVFPPGTFKTAARVKLRGDDYKIRNGKAGSIWVTLIDPSLGD